MPLASSRRSDGEHHEQFELAEGGVDGAGMTGHGLY